MALTKAKLENFTAFKDLEVEFSPGINALIGANGTGKSHLLKLCYAACDVSKSRGDMQEKLLDVFLPSVREPRRLVRQQAVLASAAVYAGDVELSISFAERRVDTKRQGGLSVENTYIPAKEMLANAPGFLSLYAAREVHFEEVYRDILHRAYLPPLRGPLPAVRQLLLDNLQKAIGGEVVVEGEEFFLNTQQGKIEFTLLAEGLRKLGLLWLLIRNGSLPEGSVLFWDEPETNLNPKLYGVVIKVLLELQRSGVQVFFATHDYVILKELDLQMTEEDAVAFLSLFRDETGEIACHSTNRYLDIHPNAIDEAFDDLYDRQIERSLGGLKS